MKVAKFKSLFVALLLAITFVLTCGLTACGGTSVNISLDRTYIALEVGEYEFLKNDVILDPADASVGLEWSSNNAAVTVNQYGRINAVSVGSATVTVQIAGTDKKATCRVTVTEPAAPSVTAISLTRTAVTLTEGESVFLKNDVTLTPAGVTATVVWSASNNNVTVNQFGKVTGVTAGTAVVTATVADSDLSATCTVTVIAAQPVVTTLEMEEGVHYSNGIGFEETNDYDAEVFRYNFAPSAEAADPFVLKVTDPNSEYYGQYILFGTNGARAFMTYCSSDLINWTFASVAFVPNMQSWGTDTIWAPEAAYDSDTGLYYLFYSASNKRGQEAGLNSTQAWWVNLNVAVSESPIGPYMEYQEYLVRQANPTMTEAELEPLILAALQNPHYSWEQFLANDPEADEFDMDFWTAIDPSPFVDPVTNKKYLLFTRDRTGKCNHSWIHVVEMEDWATPKYDTLQRLTYADDGGYELGNNSINEGPQLIYNAENQKYYLTFSVNPYNNSSYCVGQAISDSVMGPYEKIKIEDGGALIYSNDTESNFSGAGHHTMMEIDGEWYAIYHRHRNKKGGDSAIREYAIDKVEWVENEKGVTILHMNGPTNTLVANIFSDYKNIAPEATVTAKVFDKNGTEVGEGTNLSAINDGMYVSHSARAGAPYTWVPEYSMDAYNPKGTAEITLTFDDWRTIAGIIVINSRMNSGDYGYHAFTGIEKVEMQAKINGVDKTVIINDLAFDENYLYDEFGQSTMHPGAGAYASFEELTIKSITFTFRDDWGECINIQDIQLLGKGTVADPGYVNPANPTGGLVEYDYEKPYEAPIPTGDGITLDGVLDEAIYQTQNWIELTARENTTYAAVAASGTTLRATVVLGEEGLYVIAEVQSTKVYVDLGHLIKWASGNSGLQIFLGFPGEMENMIEVNVNADGYMDSYLYYRPYDASTEFKKNSLQTPLANMVSGVTVIDANGNPADINTTTATGYRMESYIPYASFEDFGIDMSQVPSVIYMDLGVIESGTATGDRNGYYCYGDMEKDGWMWNKVSTFWTWNANGFVS